MIKNLLTIIAQNLLRISIVNTTTSILNNKSLTSYEFYINLLITSFGFIIAELINNYYKEDIKKIDKKIGYNIINNILTPLIVFIIKTLLSSNDFSLNNIYPTIYTIIGFLSYEFFFKKHINDLDNFSDDLKKLVHNIVKPTIMLIISGTLSGNYKYDNKFILNILFIISGFVNHYLISKYFNL